MSTLKEDIVSVLDLETTGFTPKTGKIVEIGISGLHLPTGRVLPLFNSVCREPGLTMKDRNAWIFKNSSLTVEEVREAPTLEEIKPTVQRIIDNTKSLTAFNRDFDFRFLEHHGFNIHTAADCPMRVLAPVTKLPFKNGKPGNKFPTVEEAWAFLFPDAPYIEEHRGFDDSLHEAKILHKMYVDGLIKL